MFSRLAFGLACALVFALPASAASLSAAERKMVTRIDAGQEAQLALLEELVAINSGTMNLAGVALLLAMVGVFGALACSVQQRARDFGVRLALGAAPRDVFRVVLRDAGRMLALGIALGVAGAAVFGQWLSGVLYGVQPLDPPTLLGALSLLLAAAGAALALPAWRASRVDPVVVLRGE